MFNFDDVFNDISGTDFEEVPVDIETFVTSHEYLDMGETPLSDYQYELIRASSQIYHKDTLIALHGEEEGARRFKSETKNEVIAALGKGSTTADAEVYDPDTGKWSRMDSILDKVSNTTAGLSGTSLNSEFATEAFSEGYDEVFKVVTDRGHEITVNGNHKFVTKQGTVPLKDLSVGDRIATSVRLPLTSPVEIDDREVKLLGYWIGDGMMPADHNPTLNVDFGSHETQAIEEYIEICKSYGDVPKVKKHPAKNMVFIRHSRDTPLYGIIRKHGLWGKRAGDKVIPDAVWSLPDQQVATFLSRLMGTDGSIYMKKCSGGKLNPSIEYCTISEQLAKGVQRLFARIGISASLRSKIPSYTYKGVKKNGRRAYVLTISDMEGFKRYAEKISMLDKQIHVERGLEINSKRNVIEAFNHYEGDIYWAKIKEVTPGGAEEIFTVTATDTENYVANLVLNGNSGK